MRVVSLALGVLLLCSSAVLASPSLDAVVSEPADVIAHDEQPEALADKDKSSSLSDAQIKTLLIAESIASYRGNCPCPYSSASNGSRCGGRSAWSRGGGDEPLCYPSDVSAEMVQQYRETHSSN